MARYSIPMSNLLGGVSTQAMPLRSPNQLDVMENCLADAKTGLVRRPGSELVKELTKVFSTPASEFVERGTEERYSILVENGEIVVVDLYTGELGTIVDKTTNGMRYLKTDNAARDIKLVSVNDHTFILNRSITPKAEPRRYLDTDIFKATVEFNEEAISGFKIGARLARRGMQGRTSSLAEFNAGGGVYKGHIFKYFNSYQALKNYLYGVYFPSFFTAGTVIVPRSVTETSVYSSTEEYVSIAAGVGLKPAGTTNAWFNTRNLPSAANINTLTSTMQYVSGLDDRYDYNYKTPITNFAEKGDFTGTGTVGYKCRTGFAYSWTGGGSGVYLEEFLNDVSVPLDDFGSSIFLIATGDSNTLYPLGNPLSVIYDGAPSQEGFYALAPQMNERFIVVNGIEVPDDDSLPLASKPAYFRDYINAHPTLSTQVEANVVSGKLVINNKVTSSLSVYSLTPGFATVKYEFMEPAKRLIVHVKNGVAQVSYRLSVNGHLAEYTTGNTDDFNSWKPENVAAQLAADIAAWGSPYTVTQYGTVLVVTLPTGTTTFAHEDTWNNQALVATIDNFPTEADKPIRFLEGVVCSVGDPKDGYYVNYVQNLTDTKRTGGSLDYQLTTANGTITMGQLFAGNTPSVTHATWKAIEGEKTPYWQETFKPYELMAMNPETMPHVLRSIGNNQFELLPAVWQSRKVGDSLSSPMPSFVDKPIQDMFFYKQRLGFVTEDTVVLSRTGSYFDFFRNTAKQVLDDDPIDAQVQMTRVSKLRQAVTFANSVILFSDNAQFELTSEAVLKPTSVSILPTSNYSYNSNMPCATTGRSVFFSSTKSGYLEAWEFEYGGTAGFSATDVGLHVNGYLPADLNMAAASQNERILVFAKQGGTEMYVFQWLTQGQETLINAWSRWTCKGKILAMYFMAGKLYVLERYADAKTLLVSYNLELQEDQGTGLDFAIKLDYLQKGVKVTTGSYTTLLPLSSYRFINASTGAVVNPSAVSGNVYTVPNGTYVIGVPYESKFTLSTLYATDSRGNADVTAVVMLKAIEVKFENTSDFTISVVPTGRTARTTTYKQWSGKLEGGFVRNYITTSNKHAVISIGSTSPYPFEFQSISTEAEITLRTARV